MSKQAPPRFRDYTNSFFGQAEPPDAGKREELILNYSPLIKYIATRLASRLPSQISVDDLISCGIIGLIDAINKFDVNKNVQFKTYAEFRIKGAMLDELRALDWVPRSVRRKTSDLERAYADIEKKTGRPATDEEVAQFLKIGLTELHRLLDETKAVTFMDIEFLRQKTTETEGALPTEVFSSDERDPFAAINLSQVKRILAEAIATLPEKERLTVSLYYQEELTMKEIGEILGYTESRISQMHSKAMLRLRAKLKKSMQ